MIMRLPSFLTCYLLNMAAIKFIVGLNLTSTVLRTVLNFAPGSPGQDKAGIRVPGSPCVGGYVSSRKSYSEARRRL